MLWGLRGLHVVARANHVPERRRLCNYSLLWRWLISLALVSLYYRPLLIFFRPPIAPPLDVFVGLNTFNFSFWSYGRELCHKCYRRLGRVDSNHTRVETSPEFPPKPPVFLCFGFDGDKQIYERVMYSFTCTREIFDNEYRVLKYNNNVKN